MSGAGVIHDFEFALIGALTESVARYLQGGTIRFMARNGQDRTILSAWLLEIAAVWEKRGLGN
jgi:hypothetical protein